MDYGDMPAMALTIGQEVEWKREGTQGTYHGIIVAVHWPTQRYTIRIVRHNWYGETSLTGKTRIVTMRAVRPRAQQN